MLRASRSFVFALVLVALSSMPAVAQESVAGKWVLSARTPEYAMASEFVFEQNGTEVTGRATIDIVDAVQITDGLFEDGVLSFLMYVSVQGEVFTTEVEADVDGDEMIGEFYVPDMGMGIPFTGKRAES